MLKRWFGDLGKSRNTWFWQVLPSPPSWYVLEYDWLKIILDIILLLQVLTHQALWILDLNRAKKGILGYLKDMLSCFWDICDTPYKWYWFLWYPLKMVRTFPLNQGVVKLIFNWQIQYSGIYNILYHPLKPKYPFEAPKICFESILPANKQRRRTAKYSSILSDWLNLTSTHLGSCPPRWPSKITNVNQGR